MADLKALFYPDVDFDSLFIPYIYKEIYFDGVYVDILNQRKDMTILDVGANIGIVTDHMRPHAKIIHAIEPATEHFEALKKNKEFNKWDNVKVHKLAIADRDGEMELSLNVQNRTMHSLTVGKRKDNGAYELTDTPDYEVVTPKHTYLSTEKVKTMRFDTFMKKNKIKKVDFCKFDVEGAEDLILRSEGFINVADKIMSIEVEFHRPTYPDLIKHMENLGYQARRFDSSAVVVLFIK